MKKVGETAVFRCHCPGKMTERMRQAVSCCFPCFFKEVEVFFFSDKYNCAFFVIKGAELKITNQCSHFPNANR